MKTKEFNLSEKIIRANKGTYGDEVFPNGVIKPSDIKEFIKRLKEEFSDIEDYYKVDVMPYEDWVNEKIDKLAGSSLVEEKDD